MATTFITRMFALSAVLCAALFTAPVTPATADSTLQPILSSGSVTAKGPMPPDGITMTRFGGETRYETALEIAESMQRYPLFEGRPFRRVVLARGDNYADAIAAAPLASGSFNSESDGPVLLTPSNELHPKVKLFLSQKVDPKATIFIMGGHQAISPAVEHEIQAMGFNVTRFAGVNRAETAAKAGIHIYDETTQDEAPKWRWIPITIADGTNWHDSLIASSHATQEGGLVLLTYGATIPEETWFGIRNTFGPQTVIGQEASKAEINGVTRITAATPVDLAFEVTKRQFPKAKSIGLATTEDFADALAAAPLMDMNGDMNLIFVDQYVSPEIVAWCKENKLERFFVFGGKSRISDEAIQRFVRELSAS